MLADDSPMRLKEPKKIDIGGGVLVEKAKLISIANVKTGTYARKLLTLVYPDIKELIEKSLTGRKSNALKNSTEKESLDPAKVSAIVELSCRKFPNCTSGGIKSSLSNKLKELNGRTERIDNMEVQDEMF